MLESKTESESRFLYWLSDVAGSKCFSQMSRTTTLSDWATNVSKLCKQCLDFVTGVGFQPQFLSQLSRCAYAITFRKPYIASLEIWTLDWTVGWLEIWTIGLWIVRPFDDN